MVTTPARGSSMVADYVNYRLALILPQSRLVLATKIDEVYVLPHVSISRRERRAEQLTHLIEERWHIKSVVLDVVTDECPERPLALIEVRSLIREPEGFTRIDIDQISQGVLGS